MTLPMSPQAHWRRASDLVLRAEEQVANSSDDRSSGIATSGTYARIGCALVHAVMAGVAFKCGSALWAKQDTPQDTPRSGIQDT